VYLLWWQWTLGSSSCRGSGRSCRGQTCRRLQHCSFAQRHKPKQLAACSRVQHRCGFCEGVPHELQRFCCPCRRAVDVQEASIKCQLLQNVLVLCKDAFQVLHLRRFHSEFVEAKPDTEQLRSVSTAYKCIASFHSSNALHPGSGGLPSTICTFLSEEAYVSCQCHPS
jgi:hypothetical protein